MLEHAKHARYVIPSLLALYLILSACDGGIGGMTSSLGPVTGTTHIIVTPIPAPSDPHRGSVTVQYCGDVTGSYPRNDFVDANKYVANSLVASVIPNSDAFTLYATLINSEPYAQGSTLLPAFVIPATPAFPAMPPLVPTPTDKPGDPVGSTQAQQTVVASNSSLSAGYNTQALNISAQIKSIKSSVYTDVDRLRNWNPPEDYISTSVWGCLDLARDRFQGQPGAKYLIIASDLGNNTPVDEVNNFEQSHALSGVIVKMIYFESTTGVVDQQTRDQWQAIFTSSGAQSVTFEDPGASSAQATAGANLFGGA